MVESGEKNRCERGSAMQELISALTAHEEECSREFEADLSAFCTRHMDAQLVQQLRQLVAEGEADLAYRAFYALTIIYRNRKDYQQLQALFEENPHFAGHPSYHHLLILFQLEAETFFDALELLELAREDARQHRDNAGYLHLFAHLFVYTCEKSRGEMREQVRREYYDDVERAVEDAIRLDPAYAKFYCTKARVVAQRGRYAEAYSLINKAVATESSARKDYALRLLDYRHCETVILLQEQREYFQGEMEKLRRSVPSLPKPKTFVPGRGPKAYEGAESYCFVSYAHINSDRVYPIVEQLMQRGIRLRIPVCRRCGSMSACWRMPWPVQRGRICPTWWRRALRPCGGDAVFRRRRRASRRRWRSSGRRGSRWRYLCWETVPPGYASGTGVGRSWCPRRR